MSHNIHAQRKEQKIRNITRSKERKNNISHGGRKLNAPTHSRPLPTIRQGCQKHTIRNTKHATLAATTSQKSLSLSLSLSRSKISNLPPLRPTK